MYLWIKAFHIIAVIAWMAGMLYLPRLFVYHAGVPAGSPQSKIFKVMERRLLRAIINPAMIATWLLGLLMIWLMGWDWFRESHWLHAKLVLVLAMSALHGQFVRYWRGFEADRNRHTPKFYRIINEVVTVLLIGIVLLVVLKPF